MIAYTIFFGTFLYLIGFVEDLLVPRSVDGGGTESPLWLAILWRPLPEVVCAVYTTYILLALRVEERDLVATHGPEYSAYQRRVPMLLPLPRPAAARKVRTVN